MSTEQPAAAPTPAASEPARGPHLLQRRVDSRVIAGVASGLGDFLNVDPLLIRIAFVGLMVFGGLGLILYVGAWLLLPDEAHQRSIAEQLLAVVGLTPSRLGSILLILVGVVLLFGALNQGAMLPGFAPTAAAAFVILVAGVALLRQGGRERSPDVPPFVQPVAPTRSVVAAETRTRPVSRERRPPSPLGLYVLGGMLGAIGLLALVGNLLSQEVDPGQYFGIALAVLGVGLAIGTWWGWARQLILLGILLLPLAITASFITAPISGGLGEHRFQPASVSELRSMYRLVGGRIVLDLSQLHATNQRITISASVAVGQLEVTLPAEASVELDASVGAGDLLVLGTRQDGSDLTDRYVREGVGPTFVLDLQAGIGAILVDGGPIGGR